MSNIEKINYETNSFLKEIFDFFFIPILNNLPPDLKSAVKKTHKSAKEVIENKTSHKALEVLYNKGERKERVNLLEKFFQKIWFSTNNAKAVRNRLKAVEKEIYYFGENIIKEKDLKIFSIASGSARAVIESIEKLNVPENRKVFVSFLDKNPEAIKYSKEKVLNMNFNKNFIFDWYTDTASNFDKHLEKGNVDIIEMVGLLDYFDDEKIIKIFSKIKKKLNKNGVFITANIDNNKERKFVTNFIDWKMIYRNNKDLRKLAVEAGFDKNKIKIYYEPLKIHAILIAKK